MVALPDAMAFTGMDDQLRLDAAFEERRIQFMRLTKRSASVSVAMDYQCRRRRLVEPRNRRTIDCHASVALLRKRPAVDESMEVVVAGVVARELIGNAGDHHRGFELV